MARSGHFSASCLISLNKTSYGRLSNPVFKLKRISVCKLSEKLILKTKYIVSEKKETSSRTMKLIVLHFSPPWIWEHKLFIKYSHSSKACTLWNRGKFYFLNSFKSSEFSPYCWQSNPPTHSKTKTDCKRTMWFPDIHQNT